MNRLLPVLLLGLLLSFQTKSQSHNLYEGFLEYGIYQIGFYDTLIYNQDLPYEGFGYSGSTPLFVQVWYPLDRNEKVDYMLFGNFRESKAGQNLVEVNRNLYSQSDTIFKSYNVKEDFPDYNLINYRDHSYEQVLEAIKLIETKSTRKAIKDQLNFPVIVYHHGSQSMAEENHIMAEYFASKGFIFISANYHLPYDNSPFGLTEGVRDDVSNVQSIVSFASSITESNKLIFIGHSWGAQVGWTALSEQVQLDAFVSLETTIEFKTEESEIKDKWPFVYRAVREDSIKFNLPILMVANTRESKSFSFFEEAGARAMYFVSAKEEFGHESYTSAYLLRYFLNKNFPQPDAKAMSRQVYLYFQQVSLIENFIDSILANEDFDFREFKNDFFITIKSL